ncbi:MAG: histidine kinase [Ktedonobacterales bacterium]
MSSNYNEYAGLPPLDGQRDGEKPASSSPADARAPSARPWPPVPPANGYVPGGNDDPWSANVAGGDPGLRSGSSDGQHLNGAYHTSSWAAVSASVERTLPSGGLAASHNGQSAVGVGTLEDADGALVESCKMEYDRIGRELDELRMLLTQSGKEMDKLIQRKVLAAAQVREMEEHLELHPRQEIRETYLAAAEAEMRAFMIGEQREQMQTKIHTSERYGFFLQRTIEVLESSYASAPPHGAPASQGTPAWPALPEMPTTALVNPAASSIVALSAVTPAVHGQLDAVLRIIQAQENIRERVAQRLHDGPTQSLANVVLAAEICEKLVQSDPRRALTELGNLKGLVNATLQETRKFIFELRPMTLDDLGLVPTLRRYTTDIAARYQVQMPLVAPQGERRLPKEAEVAVFRVAQEAILNAISHSRATLIQVMIAWPPDGFVLAVQDNGTGFNVEQALARAVNRQTIGIAGMQERAEMLGGWLRIESAPGHGTRIELSVPDAEAQASKTFGLMPRY